MFRRKLRNKLWIIATGIATLAMVLGNSPCGVEIDAMATATASAQIQEMLEYRDSQHSAATRIAERTE